MMAADFLKEIEEEAITTAIETAEKGTSGEIRVHLEPRCRELALDRASEVFAELHMHKTRLRNGVLIYVAYEDHKFAIIGDGGINAVVEDDFWSKEKEILFTHFKDGKYTTGICEAINGIGAILHKHFPFRDDLSGELPNEISFGE